MSDSRAKSGAAPQRILLIKPSSLGDIVHALPVLDAIRKRWPGAHIAWLVGTSFLPLLENHPLIDELIPFDRAHFGAIWRSPRVARDFWRFVADIRRRKFDLVIDLQGLIRSGILSYFSGAATRIGFADAREFAWVFYTQRVRQASDAETHAVDKNLTILPALGLEPQVARFPVMIDEGDRATAISQLREGGLPSEAEFVAVFVGARWESKLWPARHFARLIDDLQTVDSLPVVLLGSPAERAIADEIVASCASRPINLVGQTPMRRMVALIGMAQRVVSLDSGPMHIAAALERPTVALFGPTNALRTGPYSKRAVVLTNAVNCAPCYRRRCPLGHHACMEQLLPSRVVAAVRELRVLPSVARREPKL